MNQKKLTPSKVLTYLVLCIWAMTTIYPFVWVILNSFRQKGLILSDSFSLPLGEAFAWDNYLTAMERSDFGNAYLNSLLISGSVTVFVVIFAGLAAYGLCRYRFVVLTGYRDFSYAQEAIRLGVSRFLLKPSKMDEINEGLQTMVSRLDKLQPAEEPDEQNQNAGSFVVKQACLFMEEHYAEKLTLQSVADFCYVSQWHLSKLLNRYAGKSFYDILNSIRIQKAKSFLSDPSLKIGEISEMVGYADTAHFARTFKKLEGMSANEYRNSLR